MFIRGHWKQRVLMIDHKLLAKLKYFTINHSYNPKTRFNYLLVTSDGVKDTHVNKVQYRILIYALMS